MEGSPANAGDDQKHSIASASLMYDPQPRFAHRFEDDRKSSSLIECPTYEPNDARKYL